MLAQRTIRGAPALIGAIQARKTNIVRLLVSMGANVNTTDEDGDSRRYSLRLRMAIWNA